MTEPRGDERVRDEQAPDLAAPPPPPVQRERAPLPPDPAAFDEPRSQIARQRGLDAPYIAGGRDPDIERTRQEERRLMRILIAMIVVIVASGFVLGIVGSLLTMATGR